ncbi:MAG: class I SAM-dependent methyltransferase [Labilithrix sp.]|nr:class I SAM-dependent methyltransferase [Labilithrix sp.]MCW5810819.1 class I SAM-dependent methyltransferase [Labilithrix sp.]
MVGLYRKILGHPFVYEQVRPRVVGGIDMRPLYEMLPDPARHSILDVGCGTGDALRYLDRFERYLGIDTDPVAIAAAEKRWGNDPRVRFECRVVHAADVVELEPTGVVLSGVLHHLTNEEAVGALRMAAGSPRLARVVTNDIVFVPGMLFNNVLAMMDRGRYCRTPDAYAALARDAGLEVEVAKSITSSPTSDRVRYHAMALRPR